MPSSATAQPSAEAAYVASHEREIDPPLLSPHAARSTASSVAPLALKAAATEPSGRRRSNRSGSRCRW